MTGSPSPPSEGAAAKCGGPDQLAFLVHSNPSISPEVDNPAPARQKRRRTSPEDQAILETEYQRNSKPDKATRAEIVKRVSLGDKEVQIWFQNRRQKTSTKVNPSEEHDVIAHGRSLSKHSLSSLADEDRSEGDHAEQSGEQSVVKIDDDLRKTGQNVGTQTDIDKSKDRHNVDITSPMTDPETQTTCNSAQSSSTLSGTQGTAPTELASSHPSPSPAQTTSSGPGYLANRRSASFMMFKDENESEEQSFLLSASQPVSSLQRSSSSYLRLSMTEDGHAKVIDRAAPSPNPPRTINASHRGGSLRRSHSAAGFNEQLRAAEAASPRAAKAPRTLAAPGRSRDSRAWEFWCDSEARGALGRKAELDRGGSAASAIGLMRAGAALAALPTRRNVPLQRRGVAADAKRVGPALARAETSFGRLQSDRKGAGGKRAGKADPPDDEDWEQPNTDSDKENWEPEGLINPRRPHVYEPKWRPARKALGENTREMSYSGSLGALMAREMNTNADADVDVEVARFMGGRSKEASESTTSSGEELDCVQSLLSLSQGNWK